MTALNVASKKMSLSWFRSHGAARLESLRENSLTGEPVSPSAGEYFRARDFTGAEFNRGEKSIWVSMSSEEPVERWFGNEILSHDPNHIDLSRAADGLPLLWSHNRDVMIGRVHDIKIQPNARLTGTLKFSKSGRAQEIADDVAEGIITGVSIGYRVNKAELMDADDQSEGDSFRVTDWTPFEASLVAIPADPSVGVNRELASRSYFDLGKKPPVPQATDGAEIRSLVHLERLESDHKSALSKLEKFSPATQAQHQEVSELRDWLTAETAKREAAPQDHEKTMTQHVWGRIIEMQNEQTPSGPAIAPVAHLKRTGNPNEIPPDQFSLMRAIASQIPGSGVDAGYEMECSQEFQRQLGKTPQGIFMPIGQLQQRDLGSGADPTMISTDHIAGQFIDILRASSVLGQVGATFMSGLVGDQSIPKKTATASVGWAGSEGSDFSESEPGFGAVTLTPHDVGAFTDMTRRFVLQATPDGEALVRQDLAGSIATELDRVALYGSGAAGQPTGVANTGAVNSLTFAAANPTWAEVVAMEAAVDTSNALRGSMAYIIDPNGRQAAKTTERATNTGLFVMSEGGTINGYPTQVSSTVTSQDWFYGAWQDLIVGTWGVLDILVDPYTLATSRGIRVHAVQTVDIAVRHPVSFCYANDGA